MEADRREQMKYVVVLSDGMAGRPLAELGGRTTMEAADTPMMDELSRDAEVGMASMVPEGWLPEVIPPTLQSWVMIRRYTTRDGLLWRR